MERIAQISRSFTVNSHHKEPSVLTTEHYGPMDCIGIITMDSGKGYNSLTSEMMSKLAEAIKSMERDTKIKVICLRSGHPKVFCVGVNINDFKDSKHEEWLLNDRFREVDLAMSYCSKPIIVAVNDLAVGGGFEIALLCDIIIANEQAKFGLPEIKLGLFPGIGGTTIAKTIGKY